jgi:hypothetical protein
LKKNILGIPAITFFHKEPCGHFGCLLHISHPCEVCGRVAGEGDITVNDLEYEQKLFRYNNIKTNSKRGE